MKKMEGEFANDSKFKDAVQLFEATLQESAKTFYAELVANAGTKNITFRTSSALGKGVEGMTEMYILKGGQQDVDMDNFNFNDITNKTPGTIRITVRDDFKSNYSAEKITATLLHEFLVHGVPFKAVSMQCSPTLPRT